MPSHNIRLIDNTYDLDIAHKLLEALFDEKIKFVEDLVENLDPLEVLEKSKLSHRLDDLKSEKRSLDLLFEEYDGEHAVMDIGCSIVLSARKLEAA